MYSLIKFISLLRWPPRILRIPRDWYFRRATRVLAVAACTLGWAGAQADAQERARVGPMPTGWYAVGTETGDYAVGTDISRRDGGEGEGGGTIHSLATTPRSFATLQQSIQAHDFRGERVRLSGYLRTADTAEGKSEFGSSAGLWMRVDGSVGSESVDYMMDRPIRQGSGWALYEVVLDVPQRAAGLTFGVIMAGPGQVWLDDVLLERVGPDVSLTGRARIADQGDALRQRSQRVAYRVTPLYPINLAFTQGTHTP
jgi:hypothetical protein